MKVNSGQASSTLIPEYIGSDFDKVIEVADNIEYIKHVAGMSGLGANVHIGATPPTQPKAGVEWYCTTDGRTYVWYTDADSGQWVEGSPQSITETDPSAAGSIFALWKRSAAEAGLNLVAGSFEEGGVLTSSTDVLLHKETNSIYAWAGSFPKTVSAGSTPSPLGTGGWVDRSDVTLRSQLLSLGVKSTFTTVADMLLMSEENAAAAAGSYVKTVVNNSVSKVGGWDYRITTLADERITRGDPAWVPDGGLSPANVIIGVDHYLSCGDGLTYVAVAYNDGTMLDGACGVIGHTRDGIYDDGPALNKLISYCRKGSAIGAGLSGGTTPKFRPRSRWYISETIDLLDFNVSTDWGNSELRPITPISAIAYEQSGTELSGLQIWYDHLDPQAVLESQNAAFVMSKDRPVSTTSESSFSKISRVWIYNAYQGFRLHSQAPSGGLFWQFAWENCLTWNTFERGWHLWSVSQVSTTTTLRNCHAKNVTRDIVKRGGKNYAALQHMLPTTVVEPGVTAGWRNYWIELSTYSDTRPEWASGTFYRSCGKGYQVNNVQTVSFDNCSADGSVNFEAGNIMNVNNSNLTVNSFHLEGTNLNFPDRPPIICDTDVQWGCLYLYDLRIQMPLSTDRCALIGGVVGRARNASFESLRNHSQNSFKIGDFDVIRPYRSGAPAMDFVRVRTGVGIDPALVTTPELLTVFTTDRVNTRAADLQYVMQAAGNYYKIYETLIPAVGAATPTYLEFSDLIEVSANCGNTAIALQQVGKYAKIRVSVFVESGTAPNRSIYDVSVVSGDSGFVYKTFDPTTRKLAIWSKCANNAQSTVAVFSGKNGGFDSVNGTSRMLYSAVEEVGATVEAMAGFSEVQGASMGGLPQLAPDLLFPNQIESGTPIKAVTTNVTTDMTTVLSITGKGMISYLLINGQAYSGTSKIKLTIDGVVIWDTTIQPAANYLIGTAGGSYEGSYGFNTSLKLEYYNSSATNLITRYVIRPIK